MSGLPDGTFRPELTVTRAEFVTMVNKSLGLAPVPGTSRFSDVKGGDWFAGQVEAAAQAGYVTGNPDGTLNWGKNQQFTVNGSPFQVTVTAQSEYRIDRVLYIVEVTDGQDFQAVALDGQALGHDEAGGFWYWGPSTGFTFNRGTVTTTFNVTADPGTYNVKIYAVQLP
ncbi:MAG TPA: S-layer homology domain-containing protein [Firmicutes bacterium]|nr:S-layer homology domain-containing protein [Bacillota bacterium]